VLNGGDLTIQEAGFVILNNGKIQANANEGAGGNIRIVSGQFIKSADSSLEASSKLGIDGNINVNSPDADISGSLTTLPSEPLDISQWISTPCSQRTTENSSRFVTIQRDGLPLSLDDLRSVNSVQLSMIRDQITVNKEQLPDIMEKGDLGGLIRVLEDEEMNLLNAAVLSQTYMAVGYYRKAGDVLNTALPLMETSEDTGEKALFHTVSGDLRLILGDLKGAVIHTKKALKEAEQADDPLITAVVLNSLGNVRTVGTNWPGAVKAREKSLDLIDAFDADPALKSDMKARVFINIIRTETAGEEYEKAATAADKAAAEIGKQTDNYAKAANLISLYLAARNIPDFSKPDICLGQWLTEALRIGERTGNQRMTSLACGYLGQYYEQQGNDARALTMNRKALFFAVQGNYPEILYQWQWQTGRLLAKQNDFESAREMYEAAIATLNPIRMQFFMGFREKRTAFDTLVKPLYVELAHLLTDQAGKTPSEAADLLAKTADTVEMLKKAELQDFYRDECLEKQDIGQDSAQIPHQAAVLYPIPLPDRLILLLKFRDGMKQIPVPVLSAELKERAQSLREKLESWDEDYLEDAQKLYEQLIRPAKTELAAQNTETLIIVPDGALSLIPFAVLHSKERFLIEEYALTTVPALSLTDTRTYERTDPRMLLSGLSEAKEGFAPLEYVEKELESIGNLTDSRILLDQDFTITNLETEFRNTDYDTVHLATHAVFGDNPEDSFLLTFDDRLTLDGLEHLAGMKKYREKQLDLLVLSACETAVGDARAAFGLAGVAVRAGVKSVLATLWKVDDRATSRIVEEFYRQIVRENQTKAAALQNAQKKMIQDRDFSHPIFWAPFLLIGNWM